MNYSLIKDRLNGLAKSVNALKSSSSDELDVFSQRIVKGWRSLSLKVGDRYKCLARSSTESLVFCVFLGIHLSVCALHLHKKGASTSLTQQ